MLSFRKIAAVSSVGNTLSLNRRARISRKLFYCTPNQLVVEIKYDILSEVLRTEHKL